MNGLVNGNASSEDEGRTRTSGMYKVQRPYDLPTKVPLPNGVMYEMSPVSESVQGLVAESTSSSSKSEEKTGAEGSKELTEIDALEQEQLRVIEELRKLHSVISGVHSKVFGAGVVSASSSGVKREASMSSTSTFISKGEPQVYKADNVDVVIHANPERPPYSLLFFVNLLEQHYSNAVVCMRSHVHSSFEGTLNLDALSVFNYEKQGANFRFTLVWKNVETSSMIITPVQATQILGEANIARFLSRLLPTGESSMNYDSLNWGTLAKVDSLLESANSDDIVSIVEKQLKNGEQKFLIGQPSVADLVLYSSVAAKLFKGQKKMSQPVKSWFQEMEVCFGFHSGS